VSDDVRYNWAELIADKPAPAPQAARPVTNGHSGNGYALTALAREADAVAAALEGTRNDQLNRSAFNLAQLVASGHLEPETVRDQLTAAALHAGLDAREIDATLKSGHRAGSQHPRTVPELKLLDNVEEVTAAELNAETGDFWSRRDVLGHIREFAYARMTSPWSLLGVCLLRVLAVTPAHVVLPPLIGGYGSLNMFVALVGPSGVGKGATEAAAVDAIDFCNEIYTAPVGSGEGIAHQYAHRERQGITRDRDSVLFTVPEVDTLSALNSRQGSTLLSQLRSAFSGERLGFGYADATRRIPIERHTYRLGMTVGIQPEKSAPILNDTDGGTPQRFIWLPATDPDIHPDPPAAPPQWVVDAQSNWLPGRDMFHVLSVPDPVARTIRENHAQRARGEGEALDGHALFARLKVAQALTLLDQRRVMTEDDWDLSGVVLRVSDITRTRVAAVLQQSAQAVDEMRAQREASRAVVVSETVADAAVKRVAAAVRRRVSKAGEMPWSDLRRAMAARDRSNFEEAIERLAAAGQIEVSGDVSSRRVKVIGDAS
jgi:hypothetical protein